MNPQQSEDSGDEAYRKFIVICESDFTESECEKENTTENIPKTKKQQFEMMMAFSKDNTEEALGKVTYDDLWEKLADELNKIGPPKRSSMEWRRVWSVFKYNRKRRRPDPNARDLKSLRGKSGARKRSSFRLEESSNREAPRSVTEPVAVIEPSIGERMLVQLGVLADKQEVVIQNLIAITKKIDKSNEFLEIISEKP